MRTFKMPIRAVLFREEGRWVAHCLEFDLLGDGDSADEAMESLGQAIAVQIEDTIESGNVNNLFSPADGELFKKFAAGKRVAYGMVTLKKIRGDGIEIEGVDTREYSDEELVPA
jgi:predicted RNase H-like HicB family nuclease